MWQPGSLAARWLNSGVLRDSGVFAGFCHFFRLGLFSCILPFWVKRAQRLADEKGRAERFSRTKP
jgi:hypothetical protein